MSSSNGFLGSPESRPRQCSSLCQRKNPRPEVESMVMTGEAVREVGPVLQRLELALGEGVVFADMGSAVGLGHAKCGQQLRDGLRSHGCTTVAVDRESITAKSNPAVLDRSLSLRRAQKLGCAALRSSRGGLPKRQSRVRRPPTAARVGYFPSRDPSAAWPKSIRRPPYFFFYSRVRLHRHTDFLDRLGDGLALPTSPSTSRSIGDDLLGGFFLSAWHWFPPLVVTPPDSLSGSGAV